MSAICCILQETGNVLTGLQYYPASYIIIPTSPVATLQSCAQMTCLNICYYINLSTPNP